MAAIRCGVRHFLRLADHSMANKSAANAATVTAILALARPISKGLQYPHLAAFLRSGA